MKFLIYIPQLIFGGAEKVLAKSSAHSRVVPPLVVYTINNFIFSPLFRLTTLIIQFIC